MRRPSALLFIIGVFSCGQPLSCGGCTALQPLPGPFSGTRADSAAAARLTASGFDVLNVNSGVLLNQLAPNGNLNVSMPCTVQTASLLGNLTIADVGQVGCAQESCGLMDGVCDSKDVPQSVAIHFNTFEVHPRGPDEVAATANITLQTGKLMISSVDRHHIFCLGQDALKLSVDIDSARAPPPTLTITAGIQLTVDTRWWKLLSFQVASLDGTQVCGSANAQPAPACVDSADMVIAAENSCSGWLGAVGNIDVVKALILDQIAAQMKVKVQNALNAANCMACDPTGNCPVNGTSVSNCQVDDAGLQDAGVCDDSTTGNCVPGLIGFEGRLDLAQYLGPQASALDFSIAAGGATTASDAGFTLGFTGGAQEVKTASCVIPMGEPTLTPLPLPDFDSAAPAPYDVGASVSQQTLSRFLLHAQQSGALCLELGHDTVSQLDSSALSTLLPSLGKITHGQTVPLRVVVRPLTPPTATIGSGLGDQPLVMLSWSGAMVDLYALIDDRYARLFSVSFDLAVPLSVSIDGCATLTPVIGDLQNAVSNVHGLNNEMLAEPLSAVEGLVPALISFAEPALAGGITGFTLPAFGDFQVKLLSIEGIGNVSGTQTYNHLGVFAQLLPSAQFCMAKMDRATVRSARLKKGWRAELDVTSRDQEYAWRVPNGLWSYWHKPSPTGVLEVSLPRLMLAGRQLIELRTRDALHAPSQPITVELER